MNTRDHEATALAALRALYAEADALYAGWSCPASSECCHLRMTGREPYVTSIEILAIERAVDAAAVRSRRSAAHCRSRAMPSASASAAARSRRALLDLRQTGRSDAARSTASVRGPGPSRARDALRDLVQRLRELAVRHMPGRGSACARCRACLPVQNANNFDGLRGVLVKHRVLRHLTRAGGGLCASTCGIRRSSLWSYAPDDSANRAASVCATCRWADCAAARALRFGRASASHPDSGGHAGFEAEGRVAWCRAHEDAYRVGIEFVAESEAFRARLVEQVCHIERYHQKARAEGRTLSEEEAAIEWISRYAASFPRSGTAVAASRRIQANAVAHQRALFCAAAAQYKDRDPQRSDRRVRVPGFSRVPARLLRRAQGQGPRLLVSSFSRRAGLKSPNYLKLRDRRRAQPESEHGRALRAPRAA